MEPNLPDDLNELQRLLAGWQPSSEGLDSDAMLFAAGRAAGGGGRLRLVWPVACGLLTLLAVGLGTWGISERRERLALAERLARPSAPDPPSASPVPDSAVPESASPYTVGASHRVLEQGLDVWPVQVTLPGGPPVPAPTILRAGQREELLDF